MPVEPLRLPVQGNRTVMFYPSGDEFPDKVQLAFERSDTQEVILRAVGFNMVSSAIEQTLALRLKLDPMDVQRVIAEYWKWADTIEGLPKDATTAAPRFTPMFNLRQRRMMQPSAEALTYNAINDAAGVVDVLRKKISAEDTVLEWDAKLLPFLACLDLDFHNPDAVEKPNDQELDSLGHGLSPTPVCWWRTQGGGLHAVYVVTVEDRFTAEELAVGAAAWLLTDTTVLRAKGSVEVKTSTRHPGSEQKGKRCGPVIVTAPDHSFAVLARFSRTEATQDEITEILEHEGLEKGSRLDHSYCLIDPKHASTGEPIHVGEEGLYCHSCHARLGNGFMSWGYVRKRRGFSVEGDRSLAPIRSAFEKMVHVSHVDYLFAGLFPQLPEAFREILYRSQLKLQTKDEDPLDPRVELAFKPFFFVRGADGWLHADTLLPVGKALTPADVGVLPSCVRYNEEEGTFPPVQAQVSVHINNGRIPGWVPILPYQFEPIYYVHNEDEYSVDHVRCYPKRRTTRDRVTYVPQKSRMPQERAEELISEYFPGINLLYLKVLMIAAGCAESGVSGVPMLWATGPTEAAKTTTIRIVTEMYGESFNNVSGVKEDRLDQVFGDAMNRTRLIVFDDFAKNSAEYQRLHTFVIRLNRGGHTYYKNYVGGTTPPLNNAVIFTDWRIPAFFAHDPQFGRRVHLLRLDNRLAVGWDKIGRMAEDWWKKTPELTQAANSLHSWIVDTHFPPGDTESFSNKMARLGVPKLEDEIGSSDTHEAVTQLVVELIEKMASSPESDLVHQKRSGRGVRSIDWNNPATVGPICALLVDSLGKGAGSSRGRMDDDHIYTPDNLKHVLDPFQLKLPKMYDFKEGVKSIEFEIRTWGKQSFIRLVEGGRPVRSRARAMNQELFNTWPPVLREPLRDPLTQGPQTTELVLSEADSEEIVVLDDNQTIATGPLIVHLDFESQSACNIKKRGSYVYSQHPSTRVMCAAIRVDGRRIFWTETQFNLTMPPGVEYEWGLDFLRDLATDPAGCIIVPHNVSFERAMWVNCLKLPEPTAWRDTMDRTLSKGLPAGADEAGITILGMGKDIAGHAFIRKIWGPNKRGELPPLTDYIIQNIINYNFRDTDIGYGITEKFGLDMVPAWEQEVCDLHHKINHFGIHVDRDFASTLRDFDAEFKALAGARVEAITRDPETGISAITRTDLSRNAFMREQLNMNLPQEWQLKTMQMASLEAIIEEAEEEPDLFDSQVIEVIKCRLTVTRAALAKVEKALDTISADGRAKAQLRYYGAATGRWSGYQIQPQNMKRPSEDFDLPAAITAVESKDKEKFLELCKDEPPYELLGSLVRGVLTPAPGNVFVVGDFASVEARGVLWLAGDEEGLMEYRRKDEADEKHPDGKDPTVPDSYQILAGDSIFGCNPISVTKKQRGAGKIGQLACGFGGGANAVDRMAAPLGVDLAAVGKTSQDIVDAFRAKYPKVKNIWYECQRAFSTILQSNRTTVMDVGRLKFVKYNDRVELILPSGRPITYWNARMERDPYDNYGQQVIVYDNAVRGKTLKRRTYGGKIYENAVQGFCRDLLADVLVRTDKAGAPIAFHVHDEAVLEVATQHGEAWRGWLQTCMRAAPSWAQGMPVFATPELMVRYGK